MAEENREDEPMYVISVAARLVNMHPQTLRYYERAGLVKPRRSRGHIRLYSQRDIERLRKIARLTDALGVNLAGVEVILRLTETLSQVQLELEKHKIQLASDYTIPTEFIVEDSGLPNTSDRTARKAPKRPEMKSPNKGRKTR
jgi:MerR family transcriptional regulator, heat shock protein HspR